MNLIINCTLASSANSQRDDRYEPVLRAAIRQHHGNEDARGLDGQAEPTNDDLHRLLERWRKVAIIWGTDDVRNVRPDLTDDQSWQVLEYAIHSHDASIGINWDVLASAAEDLFPEPIEPVNRGPI